MKVYSFSFPIASILLSTFLPTNTVLATEQSYSIKENIDYLHTLSLSELLSTQVVSSTKTKFSLNEAPSIITVYTDEDIRTLGVDTLSDVLWTVAGVQVQESANNRKVVWFRGVQHEFDNKLALYIDGVPFRDMFGGFRIDNEIPLEAVKRIEIIRGPGSALYGANAFSGVISIFTYKPGEHEGKKVKLSYGEDQTKTAYFYVDEKVLGGHISLEGKFYDSDGQKRLYDKTGVTNPRRASQSLKYMRLKTLLPGNEWQFNVSVNHFDNERIDKQYYRENMRHYESIQASVDYNHRFTEGSGIHAVAYYTQADREEPEYKYKLSYGVRDELYSSKNFIDNTKLSGINITLDHQANKHSLVGGIEIQQEELKDSYYIQNMTGEIKSFVINPLYQNHFTTKRYSLFLQDTYKFNDNTSLTAGIRYDKLDVFDNQLTWRLGLVHQLNKKWFTKLLFGTAYRAPSLLEYVRAPIDKPLPRVETMKTIEAQLGWQDRKARYTLTAFRNEYKDFIARANSFMVNHDSSLNEDIFQNLDNQQMYGLEFESRMELMHHWRFSINAAWLHAHSDAANEHLPLLANWTIALGLDWRKRLGEGELLINNQVIAYGKRKDWSNSIWDKGVEPHLKGRDDSFSDGFIVWDIGFHYRWLSGMMKGTDIAFTIHNVTDEVYYTQSSVPPSSHKPASWDTQYDNRHARLSISYQW